MGNKLLLSHTLVHLSILFNWIWVFNSCWTNPKSIIRLYSKSKLSITRSHLVFSSSEFFDISSNSSWVCFDGLTGAVIDCGGSNRFGVRPPRNCCSPRFTATWKWGSAEEFYTGTQPRNPSRWTLLRQTPLHPNWSSELRNFTRELTPRNPHCWIKRARENRWEWKMDLTDGSRRWTQIADVVP